MEPPNMETSTMPPNVETITAAVFSGLGSPEHGNQRGYHRDGLAAPNMETSTDILTLPTVQAAPDRGSDRETAQNIIINKLRLTRLAADTMIQPDKEGWHGAAPTVETIREVVR